MHNFRSFLTIAVVLILSLSACSPHSSTPEPSTPIVAEATPSSGETRPMQDAIQIVSIDPPLANGLSADDPVTLTIAYTLNEPQGTLQIWFERFQDADCTQLGYDQGGGSTLPGGTQMDVNGGTIELEVSLPPIPPVEAEYIGVGARLWTLDTSASLAEDMRYDWCYQARAAVAPISAPVSVTSGDTAPAAGVSIAPPPAVAASISYQISGFVLEDSNSNGRTDAGEAFLVDLAVRLATGDCLATLAVDTTDASGYYEFRDLAGGDYCVILVYSSGGIVVPGTSIRVSLTEADPALTVNYCVQPPPLPPPPPPAPEFGAISGTVTRDGIGQANVTVMMFPEGESGSSTTLTNERGEFTFPNLPAGPNYRVDAYDNAYGVWQSIDRITVVPGVASVEYIVFNP
jgi:hypothetical protein